MVAKSDDTGPVAPMRLVGDHQIESGNPSQGEDRIATTIDDGAPSPAARYVDPGVNAR